MRGLILPVSKTCCQPWVIRGCALIMDAGVTARVQHKRGHWCGPLILEKGCKAMAERTVFRWWWTNEYVHRALLPSPLRWAGLSNLLPDKSKERDEESQNRREGMWILRLPGFLPKPTPQADHEKDARQTRWGCWADASRYPWPWQTRKVWETVTNQGGLDLNAVQDCGWVLE
jgi:hypothetical protein